MATIVENEEKGGVYRSDNGGKEWKYTNSDRSLRQRAWYYSKIYADTQDIDGVYVMNVAYHYSDDGGESSFCKSEGVEWKPLKQLKYDLDDQKVRLGRPKSMIWPTKKYN